MHSLRRSVCVGDVLRGVEAHICRVCRAPLELADPTRDRRVRRRPPRRTRGNGCRAGQSGAAAKSAVGTGLRPERFREQPPDLELRIRRMQHDRRERAPAAANDGDQAAAGFSVSPVFSPIVPG